MHSVAAAGVEPRAPATYMPYLARHEKPRLQTEEEMKETWSNIGRALEALHKR